jgi:hypothetical protein
MSAMPDDLEPVPDADAATDGRALAARPAKLDAIGTAVFVVALAIAVPLRDERGAQIAIGAVSMVLFAMGAGAALWAYVGALERSRTAEIGVANLYLLTGRTAPPAVKRTMSILLVAQVVLAFAGAITGASGLSGSEVNALAFGVLVPMFGIGMNGLWAVRHGSFGPRVDKAARPTNRKLT